MTICLKPVHLALPSLVFGISYQLLANNEQRLRVTQAVVL